MRESTVTVRGVEIEKVGATRPAAFLGRPNTPHILAAPDRRGKCGVLRERGGPRTRAVQRLDLRQECLGRLSVRGFDLPAAIIAGGWAGHHLL